MPKSYFDNLPKSILSKVGHSPSKIFVLNKWAKIVAAAAFIGILALGAIGYFKDSADNTLQTSPAIAVQNISSKELNQFIDDENTNAAISGEDKISDDANQLFKNISSSELKNFLNESGGDNTADASLN